MESTKKLEAISFSVAVIIHLIAFLIYTGASSTTIPIEYKKIKIRLGNSDVSEGNPSEISKLDEVRVKGYISYEEEFANDGASGFEASTNSENSIASKKYFHTKEQKIAGAKYGNFANEGQTQANDYLELLQYTIQQRSSIPRTQGLKLKGQAVLRISFNRSGQILKYLLVKKTGNYILDQAAIEVADSLRKNPFPPTPSDFDKGMRVLQYDFFINYDSDKANWD